MKNMGVKFLDTQILVIGVPLIIHGSIFLGCAHHGDNGLS